MKKKLYITLGVIVGLLVAAYLVVIFFIGSWVTSAVNTYGPRLTQTQVKLEAAHISPFSGEGTLDNLRVANPAGWSNANAFSFKRIHVEVVPSSLFTDHIVINELDIEQPEFLFETKLVSSNIGQLLANIEGQKGNSETQAKGKSGEPMKFEIRHLVIKDGKLTVAVAGRDIIPIPMPTVDYHDLGTAQGGVTSSELAALVGRTLLTNILQASTKALGKVGGDAGSLLKSAGSALQGLIPR